MPPPPRHATGSPTKLALHSTGLYKIIVGKESQKKKLFFRGQCHSGERGVKAVPLRIKKQFFKVPTVINSRGRGLGLNGTAIKKGTLYFFAASLRGQFIAELFLLNIYK